ncbi:MAG TPA: hypothetical protein PLR25_29880, partial [Planctomycetaceae bacterium]|nr:hypothetical protein [Planctomycetaceae bacterium]
RRHEFEVETHLVAGRSGAAKSFPAERTYLGAYILRSDSAAEPECTAEVQPKAFVAARAIAGAGS